MLKEVIENINSKLIASGMFEKAYGLCEIIEKDKLKYPAQWCLGKYEQVSDFDSFKGLCYHRLNGKVSISQQEDDAEGCEIHSTKTYPCILIAGVKKDLFKNKNNDGYIELSIIENIEAEISSQNNIAISKLLGAEFISIQITGASYDRYSIFRKEFSNIEMKIPFEYAYISIEYNIIISQKLNCYTPITC